MTSEVKLRNKLQAEEIVAKVTEDSGQISSIMMKALLSCNRILSVANSVPSGNSRIFSLTQEHHDVWKKEGGRADPETVPALFLVEHVVNIKRGEALKNIFNTCTRRPSPL